MIQFVVGSANDELEILRAVKENTARRIPAPDWDSCTGPISVCGNGPSLRTEFPKDGKIAALNGAWISLGKSGVTPDYIIAHDPCAENIKWFEDAPDEPTYLLASRVHPSIFEKLNGKKVKLWHIHDVPEASTGTKHLIGGGFTIGCQSLNLLNLMGFSKFDIYGYDSSYAIDGANHASPQNWNITPPQAYQVGEKMFIAEPWMAAQVQEFLRQIEANKYNYTISVHGEGMLPAAVKHNTLEVLYDLNVAPGSFDFFCSMVNTENYRKSHGFSRVVVHFKPGTDKGFRPNEIIHVDHEYKTLMLNNVARPLLKMFAFEEVESVSENAVQFQYAPKESTDHFRETGKLAEYQEAAEAKEWATKFDRPYVITLREAEHWPQRNSNIAEWVKFAKTLDGPVIFVRDTANATEEIDGFEICPEASFDVHKRLALYRKAKMNFVTTTGPSVMMNFDPSIPYMQFFTASPGYPCYDKEWLAQSMGIENDKFPWEGPNQRLIWADDTAENISHYWNELSRKAA